MDLFDISDDAEMMDDVIARDSYLDQLNAVQQQAVRQADGAVLILAGAGTGKTRVLTTKIAHVLLNTMAHPSQILAVTFTNKAAAEMRERIAMLTGASVAGWWTGTFHALAARMLRRHADLIDRTSDFLIIDTDDSERLIKQIMLELHMDDKRYPAKMISSIIQSWKDKGLTPSQVQSQQTNMPDDGKILRLYAQYQQRLVQLNAVDFGDLLLLCFHLFQNHPDVLKQWQQRFRYIFVDEYQDTNVVQYLWLRLLAQGHGNISCVGDDDQSIYSWRGAEVGNILRFERDFPNAVVFRLEQNYRSTGHILAAASHLIAHNEGRYGKTLWTEDALGEKVVVALTRDSDEEAKYVALAAQNLYKNDIRWSNIAVLMRTSFQMRSVEEQLLIRAIPYRVIGGARFYERKEIRDALAYFRLLVNPLDDLAYDRIINTPKRGVGDSSLGIIHHHARENQQSLMQTTQSLLQQQLLPAKVSKQLQNFMDHMQHWQAQLEQCSIEALAEMVLEQSGYLEMWRQDKAPDAAGRVENLKELLSAMAEYGSLAEFLEHVSLVMEAEEAAGDNRMTLMTLHGAKGLEFDYVFLPGWEEGLFPNQRAIDETGQQGLEEERRLAYVAITRARKQAVIFSAAMRMMYGRWQAAIPSRFLDELPREHVDLQTLGQNPMSGYQSAGRRQQAGSSATEAVQSREKSVSINDDVPTAWVEGAKIYHRVFGEGRITACNGERLTVQFTDGQVKKLMRSFVQLLEPTV